MCAVTLLTLALLLALDSGSWLRRSWWLSALLAPVGALVRYEAALQLNSRWHNGRFHWGTFAVNIAGSVAQVLLAHATTASDSWQGVAVTVSLLHV
jgi:fluoride ion exporter CrcB/FEX